MYRKQAAVLVFTALVLSSCNAASVTDEQQSALGTYNLQLVNDKLPNESIGKFLGTTGADMYVNSATLVLAAGTANFSMSVTYSSYDSVQGFQNSTNTRTSSAKWSLTGGAFSFQLDKTGVDGMTGTLVGNVARVTVSSSGLFGPSSPVVLTLRKQ